MQELIDKAKKIAAADIAVNGYPASSPYTIIDGSSYVKVYYRGTDDENGIKFEITRPAKVMAIFSEKGRK